MAIKVVFFLSLSYKSQTRKLNEVFQLGGIHFCQNANVL